MRLATTGLGATTAAAVDPPPLTFCAAKDLSQLSRKPPPPDRSGVMLGAGAGKGGDDAVRGCASGSGVDACERVAEGAREVVAGVAAAGW